LSNIIKFKARSKYDFEVQPKPFPASQAIPEWWREMTPYEKSEISPEGKKIIVNNRMSNTTFKKCTPMLDALSSGYIIPLWSDVQIRQVDGFPEITWRTESNVFELHGGSSWMVQTPTGFNKTVFKYLNTWIPITPKGYSVLVTNPFGYRDGPFSAIPGVVDSDKLTIELLPPMWVKEGFEGIVEKGTPLIQITPFKRQEWKAEFEYFENDEQTILREKTFNSNIVNHYVRNVWSKKTYK
jgi:hypothetical protein